MNSFVDSPFLFFVDNVPPIFADNPAEDQRKIVEISDVGCDAITPTMTSQNNNQHHPTRTSVVKNSRPRYDETTGNKFYMEKWRQNEEAAKNLGNTYSTSKQVDNVRRPNIDEHRWKKPTAHSDANDTTTPRKTPNTRDIKSPRMLSERPRLNRWNKENAQETPLEMQFDHAVANSQKRPTSCPTQKRQLTPQLPSPKIDPKTDPKIEEKLMFEKRNTLVALEPDYPEVFDHSFAKVRCQNPKTPNPRITKKPIDETPQKTQRLSRYQKNTRIPTAKANNPEQTIEDPQARKIRSRTRSPPSDRRKRTRSFSKSSPKDPEQVEDQQNPKTLADPKSPMSEFDSDQTGNLNCARSTENIRRFIDRAVDKDSICDILTVSTSTDATVLPTSSMETRKSEKILGFWEFVPLDDENDPRRKFVGNRKTTCLLDHRMFQDDYHPLRRELVNDNDASSSRTRVKESIKKSLDRTFVSENLEYVDHCSVLNPGDPRRAKEDFNMSSDTCRPGEAARSVEVLLRMKQNSKTQLNRATSRDKLYSNYDRVANQGKCYNHDQSWGEPKNQSRTPDMPGFGWPGKNKHPNTENDAKYGDQSEKKKKFENEDRIGGLKLIEKTAACLKRKLEGYQKEDSVLGNSSGLNIEKKIRSEVSACSKLPIRIGRRLKSKNPSAWKFRDDLKSGLLDKEEDKDPESINAVRSRTKPRIKPSVELHTIVIDPDETPACPRSVENVRTAGRVGDRSVNGLIKQGRGEKLGEHLKYVEQDSRRKEYGNRFHARGGSQGNGVMERMVTEVSRNNGFKEKCFFHVHGEENRICDKYCKQMRCEKVCQ